MSIDHGGVIKSQATLTSKNVTVLTAAKITELTTKFPGLGIDTFVHERDYNQAENGRAARAAEIERLRAMLERAAMAFPNDDGWLHEAKALLWGDCPPAHETSSDAARYRWLRKQGFTVPDPVDSNTEWTFGPDEGVSVEQVIDEWMRGTEKASEDGWLGCQNPNPGGGYCPDCGHVHATVDWPAQKASVNPEHSRTCARFTRSGVSCTCGAENGRGDANG